MVGQDGEQTAALDAERHATLTWDADQPIDPAALHAALDQPKATAWSGVTVGGEQPVDGIWLRLTGAEPGPAASPPTATRSIPACAPPRSPAAAPPASRSCSAVSRYPA